MGFIGPRGDWVDTKELRRELQRLAEAVPEKMMRPALGAAMTATAKRVRSAINSSSASPAVKKAARKTIGKRYKKGKDGQPAVKVGFGVGKPSKRKRMGAHERSVYGQAGAKLATGVGLSANNVHWFVLGTQRRLLKKGPAIIPPDEYGDFRTLIAGDSTGAIKPTLAGAIPQAMAGASDFVANEMARRVRDLLAKEARKRG